MQFIVYGHEIMSGSDIGMHFSLSLAQSQSEAASYREAIRRLDPTAAPLGTLAIHEIILELPDVPMMIDLLNSPESLLRICLKSRKVIMLLHE
ncbi:hypothetical protein [Rhizobium hidalgonense]|uniref:hypothetical protein n=1 Tax=Rhizobium hidalgonense TaxID=1538159 RepID=UPI0028726512|nr:hypothetical protein [Rhizobium hidalgonense]MDR9808888.1 hypothetical protein [Rhizobium hidalgonense]